MSRLGERLLLVMAKATDGRYFRSESINLDALVGAIGQIQKKAISGGEYVEYEERYQLFLSLAFALLFAGTLISDRRSGWFPGLERAGRRLVALASRGRASRVALLLAVAGLLMATRAGADVGSSMRRGLELEKQGKLADATKAYQEALVLEPDNVRIRYNLGRTMYEQGQLPDAADHFQLGLLSKQKTLRAHALYNLANTHFRQKQLDEAIAAYSLALIQDPRDLEAKQNLELCWKLKQQAQQHPDSSKQQPKGQPQQQPQQQPQAQQQPQQGEAQKGAIGKEQADRMLQALQSKERENLKKQPATRGAGREGLVSAPGRFRRCSCWWRVFAFATPVLAAEIEFTATVDRPLGLQFQLVLSAREDTLPAPPPSLPAVPALNARFSTSRSTNISFIGGQMKKRPRSASSTPSARQIGKVVIPAASLTYQGREYQTQPIELTVVKDPQGQAAPMQGNPGVP
jgi:tetratricopeptide (TPR) repeat protein